jgi:hypothetical protein
MGTKKTSREGFALPIALLKQGALPFFALPKHSLLSSQNAFKPYKNALIWQTRKYLSYSTERKSQKNAAKAL